MGSPANATAPMLDRATTVEAPVGHRQPRADQVPSEKNLGDPNNPNSLINANGRLDSDQPHAFKVIGSYLAPWGITLGANYQALSGLPRDRRINLALRQGSTTVLAEPRGTYRSDFMNLLSLRADKMFRFAGQRGVGVVVEMHNALNVSAGQSSWGLTTQRFANEAEFAARRATTSYFGRAQELVAPRIFKFGVRVAF